MTITPEILSFLSDRSSDPVGEENVVLVLCPPFLYEEFNWPESFSVEVPNWNPDIQSGHGIFGFLWGEGEGELVNWQSKVEWKILAVFDQDVVDLDNGDRVKFPKGWVLYSGNREEAVRRIAESAPHDAAIIGRIASVGDGESVEVGHKGHAIAGHRGHAISWSYGYSVAGEEGHAEADDFGVVITEFRGKSLVGDHGFAKTGSFGYSQSGRFGYSISGDYGKSVTEEYGCAQSGEGGYVQAGEHGTLILVWDDGDRMRTKVAHVGEDGILPNIIYKLDENGNFVSD